MLYFAGFFFNFVDLHEICSSAIAHNIRSPVYVKFTKELLSGIATFFSRIESSSQALPRCTIQHCIMLWIERKENKRKQTSQEVFETYHLNFSIFLQQNTELLKCP